MTCTFFYRIFPFQQTARHSWPYLSMRHWSEYPCLYLQVQILCLSPYTLPFALRRLMFALAHLNQSHHADDAIGKICRLKSCSIFINVCRFKPVDRDNLIGIILPNYKLFLDCNKAKKHHAEFNWTRNSTSTKIFVRVGMEDFREYVWGGTGCWRRLFRKWLTSATGE